MEANSDPENPDHLSQAPAGTCRVLDWFLGTAILLLLAGVLALAVYPALRANPARPPASEGLSAPRLPTQGSYAQLVVKDVLVQNQTLSWYSDPHLSGVFLDSQMTYDTEKDELMVGVSGLYFVYACLKLQQVIVPARSQGTIKVSVSVRQDFGRRAVSTLSLDVGPSSPSTVTVSETSLLFLYPGEQLSLSMNTTAGDFQDWQLVSEASTFGLFRVAER